jgi:hypothetical protein
MSSAKQAGCAKVDPTSRRSDKPTTVATITLAPTALCSVLSLSLYYKLLSFLLSVPHLQIHLSMPYTAAHSDPESSRRSPQILYRSLLQQQTLPW